MLVIEHFHQLIFVLVVDKLRLKFEEIVIDLLIDLLGFLSLEVEQLVMSFETLNH